MEKQPHQSPGDEPRRPELERLELGEIDLTGAVEQEDALRDVIGNAFIAAEASGPEVPEWGARALARALANRLPDPLSGALHDFASTGRTDQDAATRELVAIFQSTTDEEIKEWVNWLGTYLVSLPDDAESKEQPSAPDAARYREPGQHEGS